MTATTAATSLPEKATIPNADNDDKSIAPLGHLLCASLNNYKWAKDLVESNKTLGPRISPLLNYTEATTKTVLQNYSPIDVKDLVQAVDTRVEKAVNSCSETAMSVRSAPGKLKNGTLTAIHSKLEAIKYDHSEGEEEGKSEREDDGEEKPEGEESVAESCENINVGMIVKDTKCITTERLNALLDASEGYLAQYLTMSEQDKKDLEVSEDGKAEFKPIVVRAGRQGKVAAKKIQEKAMRKVSGIRKRTSDVVHVDLVKYSQFLDKQKQNAKQKVYVTLEKLDENMLQPTKNVAFGGKEMVKNRVVKPVQNGASFVLKPVKNGANYVLRPVQNKVVKMWGDANDVYELNVVQPRNEILELFTEEVEYQKSDLRQKTKKENEELGLGDGLTAVMLAVHVRVGKEWEKRITPALLRLVGRQPADVVVEEKPEEEEVVIAAKEKELVAEEESSYDEAASVSDENEEVVSFRND